tara:strand:- start:3286 stop:3840 length:555 start_codon:yes stop_codon:yes gene_type:complete
MPRIPALKRKHMDLDQKNIFDRITSDNGRIGFGPAIGYAYSAFVWDLHNLSSGHLLKCSLTNSQVRIISLLTVKHWNSRYPWSAQARTALGAGLSSQIIESINKGVTPTFETEEDLSVYSVTKELLTTGDLSDDEFQSATKILGYKRMSEIVHTIGHFTTTGLMANLVGCKPPDDAISRLECRN